MTAPIPEGNSQGPGSTQSVAAASQSPLPSHAIQQPGTALPTSVTVEQDKASNLTKAVDTLLKSARIISGLCFIPLYLALFFPLAASYPVIITLGAPYKHTMTILDDVILCGYCRKFGQLVDWIFGLEDTSESTSGASGSKNKNTDSTATITEALSMPANDLAAQQREKS